MTKRATILRSTVTCSPLFRILSNSTHVEFERDERGAYRIDRDPIYFQVILNYMRHGNLLPTRETTDEGLLNEAQYYCMPNLIKHLEQRLSAKQAIVNEFPYMLTNAFNQISASALQMLQQTPYQNLKGINQQNNTLKLAFNERVVDNLITQPSLLTNYVNQVLEEC